MTDQWIKNIRKGDILRDRSGTLRVVREVTHTERHTGVSLVIRRCSWTRRCYTVLNEHDLKGRFTPTGKRFPLDSDIDAVIEQAIETREYILTCCDVEGLA